MRINFTARHYKPSKRLKEYAEAEVKSLEKFFDAIVDCDIILDYQKETQIAEINLSVYGAKLSATEKSEDIYKSIDLAVIKLGRQLTKYKEKHFQNYETGEVKKPAL